VQPWPVERLEERAGEIAVGFAALLTRQAGWRHRRVETLTVLSHEEVRRHVSVDFTVPLEHREDVELSPREFVVPLALLAKRPLVHFDLVDEGDDAIPLLRSDETQLVSRELLYLMLDLDAEGAGDPEVAPLIEWILAAGPDEAEAVDTAVAELEDRLGPLPEFGALAERLTRSFLLCAVVDDVSRRRIVKFAYDEPIGQAQRNVHFYDTPGCTQAASYHVEVEMPPELIVRTTQLIDNRTGAVLAEGPRDTDRPTVYFVADARDELQPGVSVRYAPDRGRFLVPAALVAWVIAAVLALPVLFADLPALAASGGPAISVLLSSSAIFSGLVLRSGEHRLVRLMLARYRLLLVASAVAAVAAGATLAFRAADAVLDASWSVGAVVAVVSAGILTFDAFRAPSATTH
jgi:hypothetical protein